MPRVIEALIDETGHIRLSEPVTPARTQRVLVIILEDIAVATEPSTVSSIAEGPTDRQSRQYRIDRRIGAGGMGETFLGTDSLTGGAVCIKRLQPHLSSALIDLEWRSLARVESPYVVRYLDRFDLDGALHIVMEYVAGATLSERLKQPVSANECAWLGLSLAYGLKAMHEQDVIHCDLKPPNVLLRMKNVTSPYRSLGVPTIIDFGLAVLDRHDADGRETAVGREAGTVAYMAPEQVMAKMLTPACDIYAFGLILWEALSGRRAFVGDTTFQILEAKLAQQGPLPLTNPCQPIPWQLAGFVEQCTHSEAQRRPSAGDAIVFCEAFLSNTEYRPSDQSAPLVAPRLDPDMLPLT